MSTDNEVKEQEVKTEATEVKEAKEVKVEATLAPKSANILKDIADSHKKVAVVDVRSGDTVRVYQRIKEGNKTRTQMFEGVVIRTDRKNSLTSRITVRRIASGVGVEKSYLMHSPLVEKVEVIKRAKVRRNYLSFLRRRFGKSARLVGKSFDKSINNIATEPEAK